MRSRERSEAREAKNTSSRAETPKKSISMGQIQPAAALTPATASKHDVNGNTGSGVRVNEALALSRVNRYH